MKRSSNTRILLEVGFLKIASHLKKDLKDSTISQEIVPSKTVSIIQKKNLLFKSYQIKCQKLTKIVKLFVKKKKD